MVTRVNTLLGYKDVLPIYEVNKRGYHLVGLRIYNGKYIVREVVS